jgi:Na+-driven multidrug efflux pump
MARRPRRAQTRRVRKLALAAIVLAFVALTCWTVVIFVGIDRSSHSASDTLRPLIVTVVPAWGVAIAGSALILHRMRRRP